MTSPAPQDCVIVCVDVGYSMSFAPPSGGNTYLEMAVKVANQIIQQKACICSSAAYIFISCRCWRKMLTIGLSR